jgi:predicted nucleotidyltransferase
MDTDTLQAVLRALHEEGVEYVLVGGAAMNLHGIVRATEDADLFVRPTVDNVEALKRALRRVFEDAAIEEISAEDLLGEYPAVRYYPPRGELFLDVLTRLGEAFRYEDLDAQEVVVDGIPVRLATPATLFAMKRDTVRAVDRLDAERLAELFDLDEEAP